MLPPVQRWRARLLFQLCAAPAGCPGSIPCLTQTNLVMQKILTEMLWLPHRSCSPSQLFSQPVAHLAERRSVPCLHTCGRLVTGSQHGGASSLRQQGPCTETYSACVGLLLPTQGWWQTLCFILRSPRPIRVDLTDDVTEPPFKNCQLVMNDLVKKHTQARVKCSLTKPTDILCSCAGSARAGAANQSGQLGHWESSSVLHQHLGSQQQRSHPGAAPCPHHTDKPQPIFNWLRKWRWFL